MSIGHLYKQRMALEALTAAVGSLVGLVVGKTRCVCRDGRFGCSFNDAHLKMTDCANEHESVVNEATSDQSESVKRKDSPREFPRQEPLREPRSPPGGTYGRRTRKVRFQDMADHRSQNGPLFGPPPFLR